MDTTGKAAPDPYPAIHSIVSGDALSHLVLHDFGLHASSAVRLIQSGFNDHYALPSHQGDFVIRVYRSGWRSNAEVTWELELVDHLSSQGAPVAACVKRTDGRWFSEIPAIEGVRQVAVFQRAPGRYTHFGDVGRSRISPADCAEQFGGSVAVVHVAADTYVPTGSRFHLDLDHLLDQPLQAIAGVFSYRQGDVDELRYLANQPRSLLDAGGLPHLDWGPCHADMSGGNSTYWNDQVIHFDFDCAGPGWRAYDLGVFFWSMSINGHGAAVWDRFIHGYTARRALPARDLALVPVFAGIRVIWLMGLFCANAPVLGSHRLHDDYFDRELALARDFYAGAVRSVQPGL
jgi:Ser/Thr protein kinase RdoA (MazF antagonist)